MTRLELNTAVLCFTTVLCTGALLIKAKPDWSPEAAFGKNRIYYLLIAALFLIAIFVRVWKFSAVPSGLNQDEAMAAVDANALARYGTDRFGTHLPVYFTAWGYGQMSVLLSYCMVPFIWLFGFNAFSIRLPMLVASLAAVYVLFRFSEKLFDRPAALVVLAFAAIDPWQIMQSRWSLDCNLLPHFLLFSVYFLYLGLGKRRYLYLSMVFFGLTMYSYGIAFYSIPLLLLATCIYLVARRLLKPLEAVAAAVVYFAVAWPIFAVVFINYFHLPTIHTGLFTIQYFPESIRMNDLLLFTEDFGKQFIQNISSMSAVVLMDKADFSWNYVDKFGRMYLFTLPFLLMGLWALFRSARGRRVEAESDADNSEGPARNADAQHRAQAGKIILVCWLIIAVFSGLMVNNVNTNRMNIIFYPVILLVGLGIHYVLFEAFKMRRVAIAVAAVYLVAFLGFSSVYFGKHSEQLATDYCSGLVQAIAYADKQDADVLYVTADSRSEGAFGCSEIYTLFGADVDARYFQGVADAVGANGKKWLPYKQRYQYVDFSSFQFDKPVGSVYVFNQDELGYFDQSEYKLVLFDHFGVAVKTADIQSDPEDAEEESVG